MASERDVTGACFGPGLVDGWPVGEVGSGKRICGADARQDWRSHCDPAGAEDGCNRNVTGRCDRAMSHYRRSEQISDPPCEGEYKCAQGIANKDKDDFSEVPGGAETGRLHGRERPYVARDS